MAATIKGADRQALLDAAGLDAESVEALDGWVPGPRMSRLWDAAVAQTGDPDLGLHIGNQFRLSALSIVGYTMLSAETLGDAFDALVRYYALLGMGQTARLDRGGDGRPAAIEIDPVRSRYPSLAPRHPFEVAMAALAPAAQTLTGRRLPILSVAFAHARPASGTATHEALFGVAPTFGAPCYRLAFEAGALCWPVRSASPTLHAAFTQEADRAQAQLVPSTRTRTAAVIEAHLRGSVPTLAEVAAELAMGERTLQRYLEEEGTTFQRVCDEVRHAAAIRYLSRGDEAIQQIAFLLGYSEASAFNRAFKRWTAQTPSAFRAATMKGDRLAA